MKGFGGRELKPMAPLAWQTRRCRTEVLGGQGGWRLSHSPGKLALPAAAHAARQHAQQASRSSKPGHQPTHRSVATRKVPSTDSPTPPPKQMPSISATCGLRSWLMRWSVRYSDVKNLRQCRGWLGWDQVEFGVAQLADRSGDRGILRCKEPEPGRGGRVVVTQGGSGSGRWRRWLAAGATATALT